MSFRNYCNAHQLRTVFGFYMVRFLLQRGFKQILVLGFFWMKLCTLITLNAYFNSLRGGGNRILVNSTFPRGQGKTSSSKEDGTLCISSWQMEVIGWITGCTSTEATFQRCSYKEVFWNNAANLQENTHAEVWFDKATCNFIEITLRHGCFPVYLLHIFRTPFPKNTSGGLLLSLIFALTNYFYARSAM